MVITARNAKLKSGYKQTQVGVIPEDWEVGNLKHFWTVNDCKHLTAKFVEDGIPIVSIREVQSRFVELENAKQTTQLYYLSLIEGERKPQPGDLIFSRNATVGEVAQVANWHAPFAMGQDVCLLRKKHSGFSSEYLQAIIRSPMVLKQLTNIMVGSTFKRVNVEQIRNLIVPMPSSAEQTAIATFLYDIDSLIESIDKLIAKKRDIKQATIQQLLAGKIRLPKFSGEWKVRRLGEIAPLQRGFDLPISQLKEGVYPVVYSNGVLNYHSSFKVKAPGVVTGRSGTIGKVNYIEDDYWPHNTTLWVTDFKGNFPKYIYYLYTNIKLERFGTGSGVPTMNRNDVHAYQIPIPPYLEQRAIATVISDMDTEIAALEQKRDKTRALKQGMMQELLTGKTRLV